MADPLSAGGPVDLLTEANVRLEGLGSSAKVGDKMVPAGDFNGDGINDVALGVWMVNGNGPTRSQGGAVYVVFGKAAPANVNLGDLGADGVRIEGALAGDHLGWSLAPAGDVNRDGNADLLIGAPWADPSGRTSAGGARVVFGRAETSEIDLATDTQGFRIDGAADGDRAGYSVAGGDVNGDGRGDFILGAIGTSCRTVECQGDAGAAYVVFGKADQGDTDLGSLGDDGFRMNGESSYARTGWAVTSGDFTGDGLSDVAVSAIGASPGGREAAGTTYVVKGRTGTSAVNLGSLGTDGFRIDGEELDQSGWSLASGDVDGDREPELVIGVPFHGPGDELMAGSVYVLKGGAMGSDVSLADPGAAGYRIDGVKTQDGAGWSVATSGDLNGDGIGEVLIGAPGADRPAIPQESIGAAYVVYGSATPSDVALGALGAKGVTMNGGGGIKWGDQAGWNVAGLGDITGTGYNVAAVGVPGWDSAAGNANRDRGTALLFNGVVDPIAPTVTITSPVEGAVIPQGTPVTVDFACDDESTLVSCTATDRGMPIEDGAALPTSVLDVGPHLFTVTARDAAGNTTVQSVTYDVVAVASGEVGGDVPATLSLALTNGTTSLGSFVPGVAGEYTATTTANVISTAADAALSVVDTGANPGRLVNGAFVLPQALQLRANTGAFAPLGADPVSLLTWNGPVSNDAVTVEFKQLIGPNDALRTGTYSKTLTFTLSTSRP
ncbi:MAG TPA: hypothetical protein VFG79_07300 [Solirubrobacter sp.]|nr:hypothetical protein [Solirubrobacter sp.]